MHCNTSVRNERNKGSTIAVLVLFVFTTLYTDAAGGIVAGDVQEHPVEHRREKRSPGRGFGPHGRFGAGPGRSWEGSQWGPGGDASFQPSGEFQPDVSRWARTGGAPTFQGPGLPPGDGSWMTGRGVPPPAPGMQPGWDSWGPGGGAIGGPGYSPGRQSWQSGFEGPGFAGSPGVGFGGMPGQTGMRGRMPFGNGPRGPPGPGYRRRNKKQENPERLGPGSEPDMDDEPVTTPSNNQDLGSVGTPGNGETEWSPEETTAMFAVTLPVTSTAGFTEQPEYAYASTESPSGENSLENPEMWDAGGCGGQEPENAEDNFYAPEATGVDAEYDYTDQGFMPPEYPSVSTNYEYDQMELNYNITDDTEEMELPTNTPDDEIFVSADAA